MALGTSVVYAKMLNGISKSGVLSQDGRTFYVLGTQTTAVKGSDGMYIMKTIPLGLQIIDTADGALLSTYQTDASSLALSLDGKSLLLNGWGQDPYGSNNLSWTDVLDLATLKVTQRLEGNFTPTRLLDGSLVWQGTRMNPDGTYQLLVYRPNASAPYIVPVGLLGLHRNSSRVLSVMAESIASRSWTRSLVSGTLTAVAPMSWVTIG